MKYIKNKIKFSFILLVIIIVSFYPKAVFGQECECQKATGNFSNGIASSTKPVTKSNVSTKKECVNLPNKKGSLLVSCTWTTSANKNVRESKLQNPLQYDSVPGIIGGVIKTALGIVGSLALLAFVVGAGRWLISAGKSDQVKKGAQTMLYAVIGVFVVLASYGILNLVLETFVN